MSDRNHNPDRHQRPKNAFASPSVAAKQRLGNRAISPSKSETSSVAGASSRASSRRSISMIASHEDAEIFDQMSVSTGVSVTSNQNKKVKPSPEVASNSGVCGASLAASESVDEIAGGAVKLMRSFSPVSHDIQEGGNLFGANSGLESPTQSATQTTTTITNLDLCNNDNSFHVLASLLVEFFQSKVVGRTLTLLPEDRETVDRLLPESARLAFIEAVRYRLELTPVVAVTPIQFLTLQCQELGLDKDNADENPILAVASMETNDPVALQVLTVLSGDPYITSDQEEQESQGDVDTSAEEQLAQNADEADGDEEDELDDEEYALAKSQTMEDDDEGNKQENSDNSEGFVVDLKVSSGSSDESIIKIASSQDVADLMKAEGDEVETEQVDVRSSPSEDDSMPTDGDDPEAFENDEFDNFIQNTHSVYDGSVGEEEPSETVVSVEEGDSDSEHEVESPQSKRSPVRGGWSPSGAKKAAAGRQLQKSQRDKVGPMSTNTHQEKTSQVVTQSPAQSPYNHAYTTAPASEANKERELAFDERVDMNIDLAKAAAEDLANRMSQAAGLFVSDIRSVVETPKSNVVESNTGSQAVAQSPQAENNSQNEEAEKAKRQTPSPSTHAQVGLVGGPTAKPKERELYFDEKVDMKIEKAKATLAGFVSDIRSVVEEQVQNIQKNINCRPLSNSFESQPGNQQAPAEIPRKQSHAPQNSNSAKSSAQHPTAVNPFMQATNPDSSGVELQSLNNGNPINHTKAERIRNPEMLSFDMAKFERLNNIEVKQLLAEIREARNLMAQSETPETTGFWRNHVLGLQKRLEALYDELPTTTRLQAQIQALNGGSVPNATSKNAPLVPKANQQTKPETTKDLEGKRQVRNEVKQQKVSGPPPVTKRENKQSPRLVETKPKVSKQPQNDHDLLPLVDVVAPADLPAGYNFEAEIEGKRFLATVPKGGVQQGETFTCYMRELDTVAIDIPVGFWKDGLCSVFKYGCCHTVVCNAILCPLIVLGQIQTRANLDFLGRPRFGTSTMSNRFMMITIVVFWASMNVCLFAACNLKWSHGMELSFADLSAIGLINIALLGFIVFVTQSTRSSLREKFMIREERCSDLEDVGCATCCLPCTICQMSRHTANYDDYEAVCCSKTGLPDGVRVNQASSKEPDGYYVV